MILFVKVFKHPVSDSTRPFGSAAEITAGPEPYQIWSRISTDIPRHVNWVSNSQVKLPFSEGYVSLTSAGDLFQMSGGFLRILAVPILLYSALLGFYSG